MNRHTIRKIYVWPAFKFGAIIGAVLLIIPGIVSGLLVRTFLDAVRPLVEMSAGLDPFGTAGTSDLAQQVQNLLTMGPLLVVWTTLLTVLLGGLFYGIAAALGALVYNLVAGAGGGLEVGVDTATPRAAPSVPHIFPGAIAPQGQGLPRPQPQMAASVQAPYQPAVGPTAQAAPPYQPAAAPLVQPAAFQQPVAPAPQAPPVIHPAGPWMSLSSNPNQRLTLRPDCTRLGSATDNDIVLPGLAAHHAEIRQEGGIFVLHDLAAGQSWVNGRAVAGRNMLKEGFQVRLSGQELVFHAA